MLASLFGVGALVTAAALGATHAVEPDHVAGIATVSSRYESSRRSALVGAFFALGHVALVVVWLAVGYAFFDQTRFPAVFDTVGHLSVGVLLIVLGLVMTAGGLQRLLGHEHIHAHGDVVHTHRHFHWPISIERIQDVLALNNHHAATGVRDHLRVSLVGSLFALSPPLSMIAFATAIVSRDGAPTVAIAVGVYTVAIVAVMSALGAGVGRFAGFIESQRTDGLLRVAAGALVFLFAGSILITTLSG